jgi:acetate kinase
MIILTLNCGSSSVKYALFKMPERAKLCYGIVDRVTTAGSFIRHLRPDRDESVQNHECPTHADAVKLLADFLVDKKVGVIKDVKEINAIGHRVVHGGEHFTKSVLIDDTVIKKIEELSQLAPLHNPANLAGIAALIKLIPGIPHIAIFDTAFFSSLLPYVFTYGLPYEWYEKYHVRKYGFHGASHLYVSRKTAALLGKNPQDVNVITLHIGNGVSITAVKGGEAYDHSMGFTPLEGAVMGTRCGDIDPAIPLYMMRQVGADSAQMEQILNRKSGILGITGRYSDRREVLKAAAAGDKRAILSFEIECYRLKKYIGAYIASLGRVDAIAFTAGVGENSFEHRLKICQGLEPLGVKIDTIKNQTATGGKLEIDISTVDSAIRVFVVPTDEEMIFADEVMGAL